MLDLDLYVKQSIEDYFQNQVEPKFSRNKSGEKAYNLYTQSFEFLNNNIKEVINDKKTKK